MSTEEELRAEHDQQAAVANVAAYSAGAVCCPDEESAERHDRAGWPATWWEPDEVCLWPASVAGTVLDPAHRRWTPRGYRFATSF